MKILNLYAGIGGNRKLWGEEHDITAVEVNEEIAKIYKEFFPNDNVIIGDAHQYLLEHYNEYDFIWSSPPCQSHSRVRIANVMNGKSIALYPDLKLWQEIIFLKQFATSLFVVENVKPYYEPFLKYDYELQRHYFWCNFAITDNLHINERGKKHNDMTGASTIYGINIQKFKTRHDKRQILRNLVNPELGLHILNQALNRPTKQTEPSLFEVA